MPKAVRIVLGEDQHAEMSEAKGDNTWRDVLEAGIEVIDE